MISYLYHNYLMTSDEYFQEQWELAVDEKFTSLPKSLKSSFSYDRISQFKNTYLV